MKFNYNKSQLNSCSNQVNTKEELIKLLNRYKGILADHVLNYLNDLIELEFSVIKESYIEKKDREVLSELEIYKRVAIYNIYNRAVNLFQQTEIPADIYGDNEEEGLLSISLSLSGKSIQVFDFDYQEPEYCLDEIPDGYKTMEIGEISLYQTLGSQELKEKELNRIMKQLEILYGEKNPYSSQHDVAGRKGLNWIFEHERKIKEYEKRFAELDSKIGKELSDEEQQEIEITNQVRNLILKDYGMTNKSFKEKPKTDFGWALNPNNEASLQRKTLIKKQPNLTIENHIKYI